MLREQRFTMREIKQLVKIADEVLKEFKANEDGWL